MRELIEVGVVVVLYWVAFWLAKPLCLALFPPLRKKSRAQQLAAYIRVPSLINCIITVRSKCVCRSLWLILSFFEKGAAFFVYFAF